MAYFEAGAFDNAIVALSAHLRRNPADAEAFANRGIARNATGDFEGALGDFECALNLNPGDLRTYVQRGILRKKGGNLEEAQEDFDDAIEIEPRNALAHYYRATIRTDTGDLAGAVADYTVALQLDSRNALVHFNRGIAYYLKKDWENARVDFNTAARQQNPQPYGWLYAHVLQLRLGKAEQAQAELRAAVESMGESKADDWLLTLAAFLLGESDEATLLASAAKGSASRVQDQRCEAWYFAGMVRLFANQRTEAAECFRQSIATRRKNFAEHSFAKAELEALDTKPRTVPEMPKPEAPRTVRGKVSAVGKRSFSIRDSDTGNIRSFPVSSDTKITLDGERTSFVRIKPGMVLQMSMDANGAVRAIDASGRK
jgi:lipoprotein NlpI